MFKGFSYHAVDESLAKQGIDFVEIETKPTPFNTFFGMLIWKRKLVIDLVIIHLMDDDKPIIFSKEYPKNHHLIDSIRDEKAIQQILRIANGWYTIEKEGDRLFFNDLRFGQFGMNPNTAKIMWRYEISSRPKWRDPVVKRICNRNMDEIDIWVRRSVSCGAA